MTKYGIDVSEHQGTINWLKVKTDFVILRAGYGRVVTQKDKQFDNNYAGCKANNIPVGVYWYSYAMNADEARQEAKVCLEIIKNKTFEYPIYFDIEETKQFSLGKAACTAIARAFCEEIEKAGYYVGIYSSKSHLESYLSDEIRNRFTVWVAHYGVNQTNYSGQFAMWQKSSAGRLDGINTAVDLDECYLDFPVIIKEAGLNGFEKVEKPLIIAPLDEPGDEKPVTDQNNIYHKKTLKIDDLTINGVTYWGILSEKLDKYGDH